MPNQKIVTEAALSAIASDIKTALSGKANSNDVYLKSQTYSRTEIDNALNLKADKSELYNVYPTDQESGSIAHITDGADNVPVKSLVSEIVAVESGSGTKSPTNPYTISGFDNGIITRCGKNLMQQSTISGTLSYTYNLSIPLKPNANGYVFSAVATSSDTDANTCIMTFVFTDGTSAYAQFRRNTRYSVAIPNTDTKSLKGIVFYASDNYGHSTGDTFSFNDIQIEVGNTATTYEAYNGNTYTFAFGQTVYGGHFDNKGNLVVTHKKVDLGSLTWNKTTISGYTFFYTNAISDKAQNFNFLCEIYKVVEVGRGDLNNEEIGCWNTGNAMNILCVRDDSKASLSESDFATAIIGKYVCYELATPITLTITSQDIPTLLGENNIFSNTGDVEVNYHADIGLYIDKKISSLAQG